MWASNDTGDGKLMCRNKLQVGRLGEDKASIWVGATAPLSQCSYVPGWG